jgi:thiamine-monophosphate kinase
MVITPATTVADLGEHAVIDRIAACARVKAGFVSVGLGDDAAVIEPARNLAEVVTTDSLVEGIHFDRAYVPAAAIGHKALAVNLSDLAAMGAEPRAALLSLVLPGAMRVADFDEMIGAFAALADRCGVALVGGNVARSPGPLVLDVTAIGSVKRRRAMLRRGARPGDGIYVSGQVGAACAGFLACRAGAAPAGAAGAAGQAGVTGVAAPDDMSACAERFLRPDPRVRLGLLLGRNRVASACVDLSDGLSDGVRRIAAASGVGAEIDGDAVPVPAEARRWFELVEGRDALAAAMSGGEDYELLFTVPARRRRALESVARLAGGVPCTKIGTVTADRRLVVVRQGARTPISEGYAHFR